MDQVKQLAMACGKIKAGLVLKKAKVLNVFSNEILEADVAINDGKIVGVGSYEGEKEIDCQGKYIVPGLIDAHVHIESSMASPVEFAKIVLKQGTTTIVADPHEMVNVKGADALRYLLNECDKAPISIYVMIPSSVPATDFETNGAGNFEAEAMKEFKNHPHVLGLGETMRFFDVMNGEANMMKKINLFKDDYIDGHAPGIAGKMVQAYKYAGVDNDHESSSFEEALEKLRAGFRIFVREGSGARNLDGIIKGFLSHNLSLDQASFCTDDKHLSDIENEGHISHNVARAIELGVDPIVAYKLGTYQTAKSYGIKNKGAIAAGYDADLLILDDLNKVKIYQVMQNGILIDDTYLAKFTSGSNDESIRNSVIIPEIDQSRLALKRHEKNHCIQMIKHEIVTDDVYETIPGNEYFEPNSEYNKLVVVERHGKNGNVALAPLKGFNIKNGALATTVAHDSHNIIVAGNNDEDIIVAIKELGKIDGGYVIVSEGKVIDELALPLFGLMSDSPYQDIAAKTEEMLVKARQLNVSEDIDPFITLSFMALPVIPTLRLTDEGLFDATTMHFVE